MRRWIGAGILLATLLALGAQTTIVAKTGFLFGDFRAFYCAARVTAQHADPYRAQPLGACERDVGHTLFFKKNPKTTIPAPLPGYAIGALIPLAMLPFYVAATIWTLVLLAAWIATIAVLSRFAAPSWEVALAAMGLSFGVLSLPFGEVVPFAVACICVAAYFASIGNGRVAGFFAAGSMIEPHLGLPACVALAIGVPATRWPLALSFGALGALSLAAIGPAANIEYFTSVLPSHALSEVSRDTQYSLSAVLSALGVGAGVAVRAGAVWYLGMLIAGVAAAMALAKQTGNRAFLACVPPAFAVFGGSFIHVTQIAAAIPAALLLVAYAKPAHRTAALLALLLLVVPWGWSVSPALLVAPIVPIGYLAWRYTNENLRVGLVAAILGMCAVLGFMELYLIHGVHLGATIVPPVIDPQLAEASWSAYSRSGSSSTLAAWLVRLPTWIGLATLLVLLAMTAEFKRVRVAGLSAAAFALIFTMLPIAAQVGGDRAAGWLGVDFRAYYCAALAQRTGNDPYLATSLSSCEQQTPAPYYRAPANVTVPAPYPPYVLALLAPFTLLSFPDAAALWLALVAAAVLLSAFALARLGGQTFAVGLAALGLSLGLSSFSSGNMMPIGLAAIVAAALCAAQGKTAYAIGAMTVAMIEPQIGLPAAVGLFVAYPHVRTRLVLAIACLGMLGVLSSGLGHTVEYLTAVLPAHALSEVSRDNQFSLATVLTALGVGDRAAVLVGSVMYVLMTALGVVVGLRLATRFNEGAMALLVPPAFALLGGSFVHTGEIAAAVPAAFLIFLRSDLYRAWLFAALILLAVPWMFATSASLFLAPLFPIAYLTYALWNKERVAVLLSAVAGLALIVGLFALSKTGWAPGTLHVPVIPNIDPRLAEASWSRLVLSNTTNRPIMWLLRLPTWIGLLTATCSFTFVSGVSYFRFASDPG